MKYKIILPFLIITLTLAGGLVWHQQLNYENARFNRPARASAGIMVPLRPPASTAEREVPALTKTDADWKKILTPEQYYILRRQGTEPPFSSPLDHETRPGTYVSADCGESLFRSEQKYDSGTGWPSFWAPISKEAVKLVADHSLPFEPRTEVVAAKCGGHLGHVFNDGPPPTGQRYCINGAALIFIPDPTPGATVK